MTCLLVGFFGFILFGTLWASWNCMSNFLLVYGMTLQPCESPSQIREILHHYFFYIGFLFFFFLFLIFVIQLQLYAFFPHPSTPPEPTSLPPPPPSPLTLFLCPLLLGTALPGFRGCNPPWLRLSQSWDHKPLRKQSLPPWQKCHFCPLHPAWPWAWPVSQWRVRILKGWST